LKKEPEKSSCELSLGKIEYRHRFHAPFSEEL